MFVTKLNGIEYRADTLQDLGAMYRKRADGARRDWSSAKTIGDRMYSLGQSRAYDAIADFLSATSQIDVASDGKSE